MRHEHGDKVNPRARALLEARLLDPFSVLGLQKRGDSSGVRVYAPRVALHDDCAWIEMREEEAGLFRWTVHSPPPTPCRVQSSIGGEVRAHYDAYAFRPCFASSGVHAAGRDHPAAARRYDSARNANR